MDHIEKRPDANWKAGSSMWSFRNEARVYGSPMFDSVWQEVNQLEGPNALKAAVEQLRAVAVPWR